MTRDNKFLDGGEHPDLVESDQTIISSQAPLVPRPLADGLHPRALGRALEGQQLDHVVLEEFVGGGGMGAVFRAWDTDLHRTVAVKVLSNYQTDDSETQRRFQIEGRSAARLDHPNIARVHYLGEALGVRYIVFEYIEGQNLRQLVEEAGPLSVSEAIHYTQQIAGALLHAFQRDVVHRDIKPSNIIVTPDGVAKLVDMGLARCEPLERHDHDDTETGVTLGTFDYIAPEQAQNPRDADTKSDIYSLGCTLFFMLTGRPLYPRGTAMQKVLAHQNEPPPELAAIRPDVSPAVASVLAKMLAKRPEDRYADPSELLAALAPYAELPLPPAVAYAGIEAPQPVSHGAEGWRRHLPWLVPVVLLALTVFSLAIWWNSQYVAPEFPELRVPAAPSAPPK